MTGGAPRARELNRAFATAAQKFGLGMGVDEATLRERQMTDEVRLLFGFYAERARSYYARAARALPDEDRRSLRPAEAMGRIYRALLDELEDRGFPCLHESVRLTRSRRLAIAASTWLGLGGRT
jgi:phytoene/squalene synthetase